VRLRVGVVGAGSVGGFIAEGLARTGFEDVVTIDYDRIKKKNLDRLLYATSANVRELKAPVLTDRLRAVATAESFSVEPVVAAVYEEEGFRAALDCDVLFSCVDRPWGRHVLNLIAYAHLIPVIDGGISVRQTGRANWPLRIGALTPWPVATAACNARGSTTPAWCSSSGTAISTIRPTSRI
jgi:tRNA A37 threonylcarbamoyladenosine dehydratase